MHSAVAKCGVGVLHRQHSGCGSVGPFLQTSGKLLTLIRKLGSCMSRRSRYLHHGRHVCPRPSAIKASTVACRPAMQGLSLQASIFLASWARRGSRAPSTCFPDMQGSGCSSRRGLPTGGCREGAAWLHGQRQELPGAAGQGCAQPGAQQQEPPGGCRAHRLPGQGCCRLPGPGAAGQPEPASSSGRIPVPRVFKAGR